MNDAELRAAAETFVADAAADPALRVAAATLLERAKFMRQIGMTFNGQRNVWEVLGYPKDITTEMYREQYERGGLMGCVVDIPVDATWKGRGELRETDNVKRDTVFEKAWDELSQRLNIWSTFQRVDKLSRLGNYAVLLIGAPGELDQELPSGKPEQLFYLQPFSQEDAKVEESETSAKNPRFGQPTKYKLKRTDVSSPELQRPVHWSRIVHIAENLLDDEVNGRPALQRVWNDFENLEKVKGGGSESFWLRANQGLHLDIDKDMQLKDANDMIEKLKEQADAYKHQLTRWLRTRGVSVETLGSEVADFKNPAELLLTLIAGTARIPKRILTGSEMGELASSQDRDNFADIVDDRRTSHASPNIVRRTVDRLIKYKYLPTPKEPYWVEWPERTMSEADRASGAKAWADTNRAQGKTVFTEAEIRERWYGLDPLDETDIVDTGDAAQLEAALRKGGTINIVVREPASAA